MGASQQDPRAGNARRNARRDAVVLIYRDLIRPIAVSIASHTGLNADDLEQAGAVGLLETAAKFESYVRTRIEGAMRDSMRGRDWREAGHARHEDVAPISDPGGSLLDECVLLSELYAAIEVELTPREAEITKLQLDGHTGVQIAAILGIRQQTVVVHQQRALKRLQDKLAA